MSTVFRPRLLLAALAVSVLITVMLCVAISLEFLVEEMAKIYVVPMLVASTFSSIALSAMLAGSRSWTS